MNDVSTLHLVTCQQCETTATFHASDTHDLRHKVDEAGWAPYGTGVTPLAEELSGSRGHFSCPRCTSELTDARLKRLGAEIMKDLGLAYDWIVVRTAESPIDYFRLFRPGKPVQVEFEQLRTDRETRNELREKIVRALDQTD
jgi:hypothetical protein